MAQLFTRYRNSLKKSFTSSLQPIKILLQATMVFLVRICYVLYERGTLFLIISSFGYYDTEFMNKVGGSISIV